MIRFIQTTIDGLGIGSTYAMLALGISLIFGVMHLVNFAHGELITVGAYTAYFFFLHGGSWWWMPIVIIASAVIASVVMEKVAFRWVRTADPFVMLLTSFAIERLSHALWQIFVSPKQRAFPKPAWVFNAFTIGDVRIEVMDLVTIAVTAVTLIGTRLVFRRTMFGIATCLIVMRQPAAEPSMGSDWLLKAVIVAVIGGLGSFPGAVLGGLALGLMETFTRSYLPDVSKGLDRFSTGVVFIIVAVFFVVRPSGLFKVESAERV